MKSYNRALFWFRRDIRLYDNIGLAKATEASNEVVGVFVFDKNILSNLQDKDDRRMTFLFEAIEELQQDFHKAGAKLIVIFGDPEKVIPKIAIEMKAEAVFCNRDFEPYAKKRDATVHASINKKKIAFHSFVDQVVFAERELLTQQGGPFRVFTPYKRAWLKAFSLDRIQEAKIKKSRLKSFHTSLKEISSLTDLGFIRTDNIVIGGSRAGKKRLQQFSERISKYAEARNYPATDGTAIISPYLRFGCISIRDCVRLALQSKSKGHETWLSELIWREFYQMILDQYPESVSENFQNKYSSLDWPGKKEHFQAWCEGRTGYPIVDAAMRCLVSTGWMHNRLRMIVASFLTKDLLIDWRLGERFFARYLLDFDLAANVGGWQWAASTGCDAQPYFRVFNPSTQSQKFDPNAEFIRQWCPELTDLNNKEIHQPADKYPSLFEDQEKDFYPPPIVNHDKQRKLAIELFKAQ